MLRNIADEHYKNGIDSILVLGDLATDNDRYYNRSTTLESGTYYTYELLKNLCDQLGIEIRVIAGNHDVFTNAQWNEMFGYDKQYVYTCGQNAFIMLDMYDDTNLLDHAAKYREFGAVSGWLTTQLEALQNDASIKYIYVCAHGFGSDNGETYSDYKPFADLLNNYDKVKASFAGHYHDGKIVTGYKVPLILDGYFSYYRYVKLEDSSAGHYEDAGGYTWNVVPHDENLWGYQILQTSSSGVSTCHVLVAGTYEGVGVSGLTYIGEKTKTIEYTRNKSTIL